jgi:GWxTD domain-containing protein
MNRKIVVCLFLFLSTAAFSQTDDAVQKNPVTLKSKFYQDFLNFASDKKGLTRLDIFIQVPYENIQFIKQSDKFTASYLVTISVMDEDQEKLISEKQWTEKIELKNFEQTISKNNFNLSLRSFELTPGKYFIKTIVEDKDSRKEFKAENFFVVRDLSAILSISDPMFIAQQNLVDGKNKILPNVSRNIVTQEGGVPIFFEVYSDTSERILIEYAITDKKEEYLYKESETQNVNPGRNQFFYTLKDSSLSLGNYILTVRVSNPYNDATDQISKQFFSRWVGVPSNIRDLDNAIAQMVYIATSDEIDYIEEAETKEEKIKRFMDYWKAKDPTQNTEDNPIFEEYYSRVDFANENFSTYIEGWKSDRGMVFIILGPPNNIDRHPFNYDSKPYEVWEYYELNRSFIFLDESGFGDYRLITPLYGDLYRYR